MFSAQAVLAPRRSTLGSILGSTPENLEHQALLASLVRLARLLSLAGGMATPLH
jgi:hypothetical protein